MDTLPNPYFERMVGNASSSFSDLVKVGERIDKGLKSRRIKDASSRQTSESESLVSSQKEEEDEVNAI